MYVYVIDVCIFIHVYIYPYIHMCMRLFHSEILRWLLLYVLLKPVVMEFHRLSALNNKPFISHSSRGVEVQDLIAGRFSSKWGLPSRFVDSHLLAVFSHGEEQREKQGLPVFSVRTQIPSWGSHLHNLITPEAPPPNTITLEISISTDWFWRTYSSVFGCCVCMRVLSCVRLFIILTSIYIYQTASWVFFQSLFVHFVIALRQVVGDAKEFEKYIQENLKLRIWPVNLMFLLAVVGDTYIFWLVRQKASQDFIGAYLKMHEDLAFSEPVLQWGTWEAHWWQCKAHNVGSMSPQEGVPKGRGEGAFLDVTREGCVLILAPSPSCVPTSAAILTVGTFLQLVVCWLPDALPGERAAPCSLVPVCQSTSTQAMNCGCEKLQTYRIRGLL